MGAEVNYCGFSHVDVALRGIVRAWVNILIGTILSIMEVNCAVN